MVVVLLTLRVVLPDLWVKNRNYEEPEVPSPVHGIQWEISYTVGEVETEKEIFQETRKTLSFALHI